MQNLNCWQRGFAMAATDSSDPAKKILIIAVTLT